MPRALHSKLFGIVWITCGLVIIALVMSFITTSLTMDVIKSETPVYGSKVSRDNTERQAFAVMKADLYHTFYNPVHLQFSYLALNAVMKS